MVCLYTGGFTSRIADMLEALCDSESTFFKEDIQKEGHVTIGDCVQFDDVTCITPTGVRLVESILSSFVLLFISPLLFL